MRLYDPLTSRLAVNAESLSPSPVTARITLECLPALDGASPLAVAASPAGQVARARARKFEGRGIHALLGALLLAFMAGGFGYYLRAFAERTVSTLATQEIPAVGYFVSTQSFSEIAEAKALLEASAQQIIQELRERPGAGVLRVNTRANSRSDGIDLPFTRAVRDLESRIEEFKGTAQELDLSQEMLWLLWRESQYDRFVEVYLNALYQHPTAGLVGRFAGKALHSSQLVGREKDMMKAFQQVTSIPLDFEPKRQVMAAVEATSLVAQSSPSKNKASL